MINNLTQKIYKIIRARHRRKFDRADVVAGALAAGESAAAIYEIAKLPDWYRDAKFGVWMHLGPQSQPLDGD